MRARGWIVSGLYVTAVAVLAVRAFSSPDQTFSWTREGLALLVTLPALLPALPGIYLVGASIWNVTNASEGGPMWPVTIVYTLMFAGVAVANVWLLRVVFRRRRLRPHEPGSAPVE